MSFVLHRKIFKAYDIRGIVGQTLNAEVAKQIGQAFGGRDHTTIIHSYRKIERERTQDPTIQEAINVLTRTLRNC